MSPIEQLVSTLPPPVLYGFVAAAGAVFGVLLVALLWWLRHRKAREAWRALQAQYHGLEKDLVLARGQIELLEQSRQQLTEKEQALTSLHRDNAGLKAELEHQQRHYEQQLQLLKEAREQLTKEFENLAHKIFEAKQQQFTQHSKTTLEGTLNPLREQLKDFRRQVEDVYHKESAERNKLVGQITELQKQTQKIGQDAVNLANALKGSSKAQGNWGEIVLERLLEESGLTKGREYETQVALKDEQGKRRNPDVIVRLPENKDIVIDAKVSLLDYENYCTSDNDDDKKHHLSAHIGSMRAHIDSLSKKDYERLENIRSLDFVFIFVPIEAAFMLALEHEPSLFKYAYDKNIILVSPTTLLATLRTVENIWRYEKQNKNAEKIATMAGGLHDQFVLLIDALQDVGQYIHKTQESYDLVQQRLQSGRGNLVKRVKDLERLGAKTKKTLAVQEEDVELLDQEASRQLEDKNTGEEAPGEEIEEASLE